MKIAALPFVKFGKSVKFNWLSKNHGAKLQKLQTNMDLTSI